MLRGLCGCSSRAEAPRQPPGASPAHSSALPIPNTSRLPPQQRAPADIFHGLWAAKAARRHTCLLPSVSSLQIPSSLFSLTHLTPSREFLRFAWVSCEIQSILEYQKGSKLSKGERVHHMGKPGFCSLCTKAKEGICQFMDFLGWKDLSR